MVLKVISVCVYARVYTGLYTCKGQVNIGCPLNLLTSLSEPGAHQFSPIQARQLAAAVASTPAWHLCVASDDLNCSPYQGVLIRGASHQPRAHHSFCVVIISKARGDGSLNELLV